MHAFWPTAEGEFADRLNEVPKYVVSSTLTDLPWNAAVLGDDWPEEVARLRKELDGEIVVYGSRRLSQALIGMGLVDELRLQVYPVVLGAGDRLRRDAAQDPDAPGRIASVRGRRREHDLCTCHGRTGDADSRDQLAEGGTWTPASMTKPTTSRFFRRAG
jgi:dihydrofolate reductase